MNNIIVTGVTGQIGSHMVDYLLENTNYDIIGTIRRLSVNNHKNISHIDNPRFSLAQMDLSDPHSIYSLVEKEKPNYFINFAANSFVGSSWIYPVQHMELNAIGVLHELEAIRKHSPQTRYLNLGSSEEFGDVQESPQTEKTPLRPRSPYGASKAAARFLVKVYKESYSLYALQPWNFNTEGKRRGEEFVTRKITMGVARIKKALELNKQFEPIELAGFDMKRDWQASMDVCDGIWRMLNQDIYRKDFPSIDCGNRIPYIKEYILASGKTHSIREFVELAFKEVKIEGIWRNSTTMQKPEYENFQTMNGQVLVKINPKFYRPADVEHLCGDSTAIRKELGWEPKISFQQLIKEMVLSDIQNLNE
jgi:GDPmannose 4,6-dehydratase